MKNVRNQRNRSINRDEFVEKQRGTGGASGDTGKRIGECERSRSGVGANVARSFIVAERR